MKKKALALTLFLVLLILGVAGSPFLRVVSANFDPNPSPQVIMVSPAKNGVYAQSNVPLNVKVEMFRFSPSNEIEAVDWLNYSLDGQADVALATTHQYPKDGPGQIATGNGLLSGLSDGMHSLFIHGETTFKKYFDTRFSATVYFTVDTIHPSITVHSPVALETYTSTNVTLNYVVNEPASWAGYSLDLKANVTSRINTTLTGLSYGTHVLKVYANDTAGNECVSKSIVFSVKDIDSPSISILSAENKAYNTSDIPLNFTTSEPVSWIAYSVDNKANVTVTGNTTFTALANGSHTLTVYANDTSGNMVASDIITFSIIKDQEPEVEPFPTVVATALGATVILGLATIVFFKKHNRGR